MQSRKKNKSIVFRWITRIKVDNFEETKIQNPFGKKSWNIISFRIRRVGMIIPSRETGTILEFQQAVEGRPLLKSDDTPGQEKICQQLTTTIQNIIHVSKPDPLKFSNRHQVESPRSWSVHTFRSQTTICWGPMVLARSKRLLITMPCRVRLRYRPLFLLRLQTFTLIDEKSRFHSCCRFDSKEEEGEGREGDQGVLRRKSPQPFRVLCLPFLLHFYILKIICSFFFFFWVRQNWRQIVSILLLL